MRSTVRLLACIAPVPAILAGVAYVNVGRQVTPPTEIPQPGGWVPFAADFETTEPGKPDILGRYYRGSDGSFRSEQNAKDGSVQAIAISNIAEATAYLFLSRRGQSWVKRPMLLPPAGFKPLKRKQEMKGLSLQTESVQGFDTYRYVDPTGGVELQAPALNFFPLLYERAHTLERRQYFNIKLGEQPREIFQPPPGAEIEYMETPIPNGVPVSALPPPPKRQ